MPKARETVVDLSNVSFSYGHQIILDQVNLSVERGDFVGVIGPNGSGKTTIVKLILGLLKPDAGTIRLFGEEFSKFRDWKRVGYVPQKATGFDQNFPATVFEVASMGRIPRAGILKQLSASDNAAVERTLSLTGMLQLRDKRIGELSGGQQQRVFIARALAAEPDLLILDEPTVGVDAEAQHSFYALLMQLNRDLGMTLILISHDVGMISENVTKLACVNVRVTVHDVSKGMKDADLHCAYPAGLDTVKHHHD